MQDSSSAVDPADTAGTISKLGASLLASAAFVVPYVISRSTTPSPDHPRIFFWYRWLRTPAFKPPDIAFPVAWTAIQSGLAWGAYRLIRAPASAARREALTWLGINVVGIGAWSRLFFGNRNLPASTVGAAALIGTSAAYVSSAAKLDKGAAKAGVPLVVWVAFATVLTAEIWRRNR